MYEYRLRTLICSLSQDTVIVDTNVTRHLDDLLRMRQSSQWDALILHYLGLDHVGHLGGPGSPLMAPKQREMDAVIKRVFEYLEKQDAIDGQCSLLVLVGDHGMTEVCPYILSLLVRDSTLKPVLV